MFTEDAIDALQKTELQQSVQAEIRPERLAAVPPGFSIYDLEKHMPNKRRAANQFRTTNIAAWAKYVGLAATADHKSKVFVDPEKLSALAVLNFQTKQEPGHCDDTATLNLQTTPEHRALQAACQRHLSQREIVEFFEDQAHCATLWKNSDEPEQISLGHGIQALRSINIDHVRKAGSDVADLSHTRSAMESVIASTKAGASLPTLLYFEHTPYVGLSPRTYLCRIAVLTGGTAPMLYITIKNEANHLQAMAEELQAKIIDALGPDASVFVGNFATK